MTEARGLTLAADQAGDVNVVQEEIDFAVQPTIGNREMVITSNECDRDVSSDDRIPEDL